MCATEGGHRPTAVRVRPATHFGASLGIGKSESSGLPPPPSPYPSLVPMRGIWSTKRTYPVRRYHPTRMALDGHRVAPWCLRTVGLHADYTPRATVRVSTQACPPSSPFGIKMYLFCRVPLPCQDRMGVLFARMISSLGEVAEV